MRSYKHYSGATVEVDSHGKKTLWRYGLKFKTFTELKAFKKECAAKSVRLTNKDFGCIRRFMKSIGLDRKIGVCSPFVVR